MFGGGGGATRCQRTRREGRYELVCRSRKESQADKNPWEDGRSRKHRGHCQFTYRREREGDGGSNPHRSQQCCVVMENVVIHKHSQHALGKTLQGAAGKGWSWRHLHRRGWGAGMSMKVYVMLGAVTSLRLHSRVFWLSQLKMRLLLIVSTDHSFFIFSFIYLYPALFWGKKNN